MSLYNNVSDSLFSKGLVGALQSGANSVIKSAAGSALSSLGGGKLAQAAIGAASSAASQAAKKAIDKNIPPQLRGKLDSAGKVVGGLMKGDFEGAALSALEGGFLDGLMGNLGGTARENRQRNQALPIYGGLSIAQVQRLHDEVLSANHVRKNLFVLEITSYAEGDMSDVFNLLCVDLEYEPWNIAADKQRAGGVVLDFVTGQEAVEMRMTTYDNEDGALKSFFARHHAAVAAQDGSVGVPAEYALKIKVLHGVAKGGNRVSSAYADEGLFRVASCGVGLSRREQALQELPLTFSQLDTFMKP